MVFMKEVNYAKIMESELNAAKVDYVRCAAFVGTNKSADQGGNDGRVWVAGHMLLATIGIWNTFDDGGSVQVPRTVFLAKLSGNSTGVSSTFSVALLLPKKGCKLASATWSSDTPT